MQACKRAADPPVLRPPRRRDLAAAIWRPALAAAEVVLQRGRLLEKMGWQRGAKLYLHPEEAL